MNFIILKPKTAARQTALAALAEEGLAGPNYNLDDISAEATLYEDSIYISFWDMCRTITDKNPHYNELRKMLLNKNLKK